MHNVENRELPANWTPEKAPASELVIPPSVRLYLGRFVAGAAGAMFMLIAGLSCVAVVFGPLFWAVLNGAWTLAPFALLWCVAVVGGAAAVAATEATR